MPSSAQTDGGNDGGVDAKGGVAPGRKRGRATLLARLCQLSSLRKAFDRVRRNNGGRSSFASDEFSVEQFAAEAEMRIRSIRDRLHAGTFVFSPLRPVAIEKKGGNGYRPILVPSVADRIVQRAILHQISAPLAPHVSSRTSHAFRQNDSGVRSAVHRLRDEIKDGRRVVLVVDIKDFFSAIDSERLYADLRLVLPDDSLFPLLKQLQNWEINDLSSLPWNKKRCFPQAGKGVPQGSALSPILSNFYLRTLDKECEDRGLRAIRYADDIAIACESVVEAQRVFCWLAGQLDDLGLSVHPLGTSKKSRVVELRTGASPGIEYLGFFLMPSGRGVRIKPSDAAFKNALAEIAECFGIEVPAPLIERYSRLTHFLSSWVATYEQVCGRGKIDGERAKLLEWAQRCLSALLVERKLLNGRGLTSDQRQFLGVDSVFTRPRIERHVPMKSGGANRGKHKRMKRAEDNGRPRKAIGVGP